LQRSRRKSLQGLFNETIEGMDASAVIRYITEEFDHVVAVEKEGDTFFTYDPSGRPPDGAWLPFATVVTGDRYDRVSNLDRDGAYRLNIGLTKATYTGLFGAPPRQRDDGWVLDTGFDYATEDRLMPHPYYGSQYWVCVVDPSEATFEEVKPLLAEAHAFAARKAERWTARSESDG
jgi:Family of unknown function (DUF6194)